MPAGIYFSHYSSHYLFNLAWQLRMSGEGTQMFGTRHLRSMLASSLAPRSGAPVLMYGGKSNN